MLSHKNISSCFTSNRARFHIFFFPQFHIHWIKVHMSFQASIIHAFHRVSTFPLPSGEVATPSAVARPCAISDSHFTFLDIFNSMITKFSLSSRAICAIRPLWCIAAEGIVWAFSKGQKFNFHLVARSRHHPNALLMTSSTHLPFIHVSTRHHWTFLFSYRTDKRSLGEKVDVWWWRNNRLTS
jgi:hypothetical protein